MRIRRGTAAFVLAALIAGAAACGMPLLHMDPNQARPLGHRDWRQPLVGVWIVEFAVDSMLLPYEPAQYEHWKELGSAVWIVGAVELRDSMVNWATPALKATLAVDFQPVLGRQISCYEEGRRGVELAKTHRGIRLDFAPGWVHCGLIAEAHWSGDSLVGDWAEPSYAGVAARGRFRMRRPSTESVLPNHCMQQTGPPTFDCS